MFHLGVIPDDIPRLLRDHRRMLARVRQAILVELSGDFREDLCPVATSNHHVLSFSSSRVLPSLFKDTGRCRIAKTSEISRQDC